jgi:hypothetical protein
MRDGLNIDISVNTPPSERKEERKIIKKRIENKGKKL